MSVSKLLNSDLAASWKPIPKCSICFSEFIIGGGQTRKRPLILSCYHNACEECVFSSGGRHSPHIQCRVCNVKTEFVKDTVYRQYFELNYFLNGFLFYKTYILPFDVTKSTSFGNGNNENAINNHRYECSECNREYTQYFCIQCSVPYCTHCFKKLHKNGKAFKKHNLSLLVRDNTNEIFKNLREFKKCKIHKQILNKYCQACKVIICGNCVTSVTHQNHSTTSLQNENKKYLQQISSLIETVKMAKESNRTAITDSKFVEKRYDQHCNEAIEYVTSYYLKLHNILQVSETRTLMKIKENILSSIGKVKQTQSTLESTSASLDDLIIFLQKIVEERPSYPLADIIERTNHFLETRPCQVKFDNFESSPFSISEKNITELDLENWLNVKCNMENEVNVNILTFFGDVSDDDIKVFDTTESISSQQKLLQSLEIDTKPKKPKKKLQNMLITDIKKSTTNRNILYTQSVHVSHIENAQEFYVQSENFRLHYHTFNNTCKQEGVNAETPDYIDINDIYLVLSENIWYRGQILKLTKTSNSYKVFLIDFGSCIDIAKQYIRQISDDLKNKPKQATKCTLVGIKCKNDRNAEANSLMSEIIENNKQLINMVILKEEDEDTWIVDLIATNNFATSISDALIFTDFADKSDIDKNDKELNRNLHLYSEMKKKLIPSIKKSFYKTVLSETINNRIIPLNIKDPQEFYVTKFDLKSDIEELSNELSQTYYKNNMKIYLPRINMPCAVCVKGKWCRGRILEVESKLKCKVWLVDYGIFEIVVWKQLRVLDEKFLKNNEYSFQCSLMDIEPLQSNNYAWTSEAITEFKRIMKHTNLQIFVHNSKDFCHKITLFIVKKTVDINVNALMVEHGFAISTGTESLVLNCPKLNNQGDELLLPKQKLTNQDNNMETKKLKQIDSLLNSDSTAGQPTNFNLKKLYPDNRIKVLITSIKSPGEFYIILEKHLVSIKKLHNEIQTTQNQKLSDNPESTIKHDWQIKENCLVYIKLCNKYNKIYDAKLEWYHRATIIDLDSENDKYTVFLRDNGETIDNITVDKISPIDAKFNRLCDTILKCHLASVKPTSNMENWSHSAIDELKELIGKFETISATVQGKRCNDSLPVVLWGMTSEYADPLGPNICKWVNINKILVNGGLAHLDGQFDKGKQNLTHLDKEFEEYDKIMKELWSNVVEDISKAVENKVPILKEQNNLIEETVLLNFSDDDDFQSIISSWLPAKPIEKSLFTAIPTYIDNDGYIHLHDARNEPTLDKIKQIINEKFENNKITCLADSVQWYPGQPCIARFHLDNLYYRGEIVNIKSNNMIQVCFVDYGNIEDCNPSDLIKDLCLTKIPIQAVKYELDGIVPNTENCKWSRDVLDFLHSIIVMKMCSIRISDNSINDLIKKCSIRCESDNIIDVLIENKYAIKKFDKLLQSESHKQLKKAILRSNTVRQFLSSSEDEEDSQENSDDETEILIGASKRTTDANIVTRKDSDYYKKLFEKKELQNLYTTIMSGKELPDEISSDMDCTFPQGHKNFEFINESSSTSTVDEPVINLFLKNRKSADDDKENNLDIDSINSFNPKDTSTVMSRFDDLDNFRRYELPFGVNSFYCEINIIRDAINFYIHPLLSEHEKVYREMNQRIQVYAKTATHLSEFLPKTPCLAMFAEDNLWYRAVIKSQNPNSDKVDVIYVDYLNSDTIPITKIRKCSSQILKYPMRLMQVQLSGLRPNPRWRNSDIIRKLSELFKNRKFFAKIIKPRKIPEIQLFVSQSDKNFVLQDLIKERIYLLKAEK